MGFARESVEKRVYNQQNINNIEVPDIKFRLFSFQLQNERWLNRRFSNINQLKKFLLNYQPLNSYQSVSLYNFYMKKPKRFKSEMFLDLDSTSIDNLCECINLLKEKKYTINRIIFSGGGFHIYLNEVVRFRKRLVNYLKSDILSKPEHGASNEGSTSSIVPYKEGDRNINIDTNVHDRSRISRISGSWNGNRKSFSFAVKEAELERLKPMTSIWNPTNNVLEEDNHSHLPQTYYYKYITTKNRDSYVFFKKYRRTLREVEAIWGALELKYGVGTCLILDYSDYFALFGLKAHSYARLKKMDKTARKHHIRTSAIYDIDNKETKPAPKFVKLLLSYNKENLSLFHCWYANYVMKRDYFDKLKQPNIFVGKVRF